MFFCLEKNNFKLYILLILSIAITGCTKTMVMSLPEPVPLPAANPQKSTIKTTTPAQQERSKKEIQNIQFEHLAPIQNNSKITNHLFPKGKLFINADKMPLNEFIHTSLSELLNFTVSVTPSIASRNDPVTLNVVKPVKPEILLGMVEETLQLLDIGLTISSSGIIKVTPLASSLKSPATLLTDHSLLTQGQVIAFIPLEYADISETLLFSNSVFQMGLHGRTVYNKRLGAIMVVGTSERVKRFQQLIAALDKPSLSKRNIRLIKPEYWQVTNLVKILTKLLSAQSIPVFNKKTGQAGLQFIELEQLNTLVVVSPKKQWAEFVTDTVKKIDTPSASADTTNRFVYFVKNTRADALGDIIGNILSPYSGAASNNSTGNAENNNDKKPGRNEAKSSSSVRQLNKLKVIIDTQHNALIFVGNAAEYEKIIPLLKQLDIPAKQVLIEVTIAEITLDETTQLGAEWSILNSSGKALSTMGGLGIGNAGLNYTQLNSRGIGDLSLHLNAMIKTGQAKILSRPRLLAMDNEEAKIQVGTEIAILSKEVTDSQSVDAGSAAFVRTYKYVDTGVILNVTPSINEGGVVRLDINQEVSETPQITDDKPPIFKRTIKTSLLTTSGQSIIIGGLISHTEGETINKVPLLGDIPLLGALFRSVDTIKKSTELMILVTPYIINNNDDANHYTTAFRNQLGWE